MKINIKGKLKFITVNYMFAESRVKEQGNATKK